MQLRSQKVKIDSIFSKPSRVSVLKPARITDSKYIILYLQLLLHSSQTSPSTLYIERQNCLQHCM